MRLIDADALKGEPIKQSIMVQRLEINFSEETKEFLLKALQTESVVRCKECKNAGRKMGTHYHCEQQMSWHEEEYFCSYGGRREP